MTLTPYQIIAPILSLIAIAYAWSLMSRQRKTIWEAGLWTLFWGFIAVIALFPSIITYLSTVTGIKDQSNAVVFTFIGILLFMNFYMVMRMEELDRRHKKIVRVLALKDAGLDERNGDS